MTRPVMAQLSSGKQHNLQKAKYPATIKDSFVIIEHAGGVLQVPFPTLVSLAWGPEDPVEQTVQMDPNAAQVAKPQAQTAKPIVGKAV